jgi:hypothetical protein
MLKALVSGCFALLYVCFSLANPDNLIRIRILLYNLYTNFSQQDICYTGSGGLAPDPRLKIGIFLNNFFVISIMNK